MKSVLRLQILMSKMSRRGHKKCRGVVQGTLEVRDVLQGTQA